MTAINRPGVRTHHLITVLVTAAVSAGLIVGLILALSTTTSSSRRTVNLTRANSTLCRDYADVTPGSPAAFRLADEIAVEGSC